MSTHTNAGDAGKPRGFTPSAGSRIRPVTKTSTPSNSLSPPAVAAKTPEKPSGDNWREDGSYIVGKGVTPVHTRWQKGQSGNPRGKKKGTKNTDTIICELMESSITVKTAAGEKKMSRKAALFHRMWELAAKGDYKAACFLFDRYADAQKRRAEKEVEQAALSSEELETLESYMQALGFGSEDQGEPS